MTHLGRAFPLRLKALLAPPLEDLSSAGLHLGISSPGGSLRGAVVLLASTPAALRAAGLFVEVI
jgi:hypothetical protein